MAQTYTRQSTFADGDTITAALFNDEYNQLVNAFTYSSTSATSTGHRHDGTAGQGGNILKIGDLDFLNKIEVDSTNNRWGFYVEVSSAAVEQIRIQDGAIVPVTDNDIDLGTSSLEFKDLYLDGTATIDTLTVNEAATVGTTLGVTGATTLSSTLGVTGAATLSSTLGVSGATTLSSTLAVTGTSTLTGNVTASNDLSIGGNLTVTGNATISGNLTFGNADTDSITLTADVASNIIPDADNTYDLGSSTKEWKDIYIDGTAYLDAINFNGTAITATAAELNIMDGVTATATEINLLDGVTSTTAELNILDGVTSTAAEINLVDGSSAGTIVNSKAVIYGSAGEVNATTLQVGGTSITSTPAELNILDGVTSTTAELNILDGVTATTAEINILDGVTSTTTELNIVDGNTSATSTTLADADRLIVNDNGTMVQVALTDFETYFESAIDTINGDLTVTGDLTISGDDLTMATNTAGHLLIADGTNFNPTAVGDLSEISSVANDDVLLAVDTSGGGLKKIARSTLVAGLATSSAISNVVEDTTPQLGGDLDVNGNGLVSTSNGNIALTPNGTGVVRIDGNVDIQTGEIVLKNGGSVSNIKLYCESSNAHYTQLQSAAHSAYSGNVTVTLPAATDTLVGKATTDTLTNKTLTSPKINEDVAVTATATELNILDGVTSTTAELNILDGVTATATELNILDGVTSTTAELNILDGVTSTAAELNILDGVTSTTAELNILDGVTSTTAELNILDGVTSTTAELNILDGVTATTAELNYVDGVTSAIQTQLDAKAPVASPTFTGTVTIPTADVNGGNIDGTIIGASTAAAGTFTTITGSGDLAIDTDTLFVDVSEDKVGIGTSSPNQLLTLGSGSASATIGLDFETTNTIRGSILYNAGTGEMAFTSGYSGYGGFMTFDCNGSERMRIDSSGNVGIGTASPGDYHSLGRQLVIAASGDAGMTIASGSSNDGRIFFADGTSGSAESAGQIGYDHATNAMSFYTSDSEEMRLESDGDLHVDGNVVAYSTTVSDKRLKDDVQDITGALDTVDALRGVTYTWNTGSREGQRDYGVIAQEVEQVIPEIVHDTTMPLLGDEETVYKTVDYEKLCAVLINAVSELRAEVEGLKNGTSV